LTDLTILTYGRHQIHCTWEKVWDLQQQRLFWYNHQTKVEIIVFRFIFSQTSTWEKPLLLIRYGDVENPPLWVVIDDPSQSDAPSISPDGSKKYSYWHVTGQKSLPVIAIN
jgi:hypothetical protein